ncbi:hypothetical protein COOONC_06151 [Cooperia oncophora]
MMTKVQCTRLCIHDEVQGSNDTTDVKSCGTRSAKSGSRSQTSKSATTTQTTQDGGDEVLALFIFGLFLLIAIVEVVVGSLNVHNCPVNNMIPIWLIVSGGVSCLRYTLHICFGIVVSYNVKFLVVSSINFTITKKI